MSSLQGVSSPTNHQERNGVVASPPLPQRGRFSILPTKIANSYQKMMGKIHKSSIPFTFKFSHPSNSAKLNQANTDPTSCGEVKSVQSECNTIIPINHRQLKRLQIMALFIQLIALSTRPRDPIYKSLSNKEYYHPHITLTKLASHFMQHIEKWNYKGVTIQMKLEVINTKDQKEEVVTLIFFRKNALSILEKIKKVICSEKSRFDYVEEHMRQITPKLKDWGYKGYKVGKIEDDFFQNGSKMSEYETYVKLFYKEKI